MADDNEAIENLDPAGGVRNEAEVLEEDNLIEEIAKNVSVAPEDQSRSVLHTGTTYEGDVAPGAQGEDSRDVEALIDETASNTDKVQGPVADVNEGPAALSLDGAALAENAAGAVVGTLSVVDPDAGDSHSFTVSDDRFEVVDGQLKLKDDVHLDHEDAAQLDVTVTATDAGGLSVSESFAITVADVNEGPAALSLDGAALAENAAGAVVGTLSVVDPDAGDSHSFTVSDDRFEVVDGQLKLKNGVRLDHEDAAQLDVTVTATDAGGLSVSESFSIDVVEMPSVSTSSGFHARYFDMDTSLSRLSDVDWQADPTFEEISTEINYANGGGSFWDGGSTDTFASEISGTINVTEEGNYSFFLGGDDGCQLLINGELVIANDGLHGFRTRTGEIELEPGAHHIEVRYFENYGSAGLKLEWDGPGTDGRELVTAPDGGEILAVSGVPTTIGVSLGADEVAEGTILTLEGLPEGTTVSDGETEVTVATGEAVDVTDWDISLLSVRPPVDFVGDIDAALVVTVPVGEHQEVHSSHDIPIRVDTAHISEPNAEMFGGFTASYFDVDHSLREIDDISWDDTPTHEEVVSEINYTNSRESFWEGGSTDTFGVKLEGQITVDEGGLYTFLAGGDDGVVVYIDGKPVVENDGIHGFRTRSGEIDLEPGTYDIEVRYFENHGHAGLKLEWEGPGVDGRQLVCADADLAVDVNDTLTVGLSDTVGNDIAEVLIEGLPAGTIVVSGDESDVVGDGPLDVSGWNTSNLEISPPAGFEGEIAGAITVTETAFNGATVTGTSEFKMTVGDPTTPRMAEDESLMLVHQSGPQDQPIWSDTSADGDYEEHAADDIMSEEVVPPGNIADTSALFETHEHFEL